MGEINLFELKKVIFEVMKHNSIKTQKELAVRLGYAESYLSQVLTGRVSCNKRFLDNLTMLYDGLDIKSRIYKQDDNSVIEKAPAQPIEAQSNDFEVTKASLETENKMLREQLAALREQYDLLLQQVLKK